MTFTGEKIKWKRIKKPAKEKGKAVVARVMSGRDKAGHLFIITEFEPSYWGDYYGKEGEILVNPERLFRLEHTMFDVGPGGEWCAATYDEIVDAAEALASDKCRALSGQGFDASACQHPGKHADGHCGIHTRIGSTDDLPFDGVLYWLDLENFEISERKIIGAKGEKIKVEGIRSSYEPAEWLEPHSFRDGIARFNWPESGALSPDRDALCAVAMEEAEEIQKMAEWRIKQAKEELKELQSLLPDAKKRSKKMIAKVRKAQGGQSK